MSDISLNFYVTETLKLNYNPVPRQGIGGKREERESCEHKAQKISWLVTSQPLTMLLKNLIDCIHKK